MKKTFLIMEIIIALIFLFLVISLFYAPIGELRRKMLTSEQFKTCVTIFFGLATTTGVLFSIYQIQENHQRQIHEQKYEQAKKISVWNQGSFSKDNRLYKKVRVNNESSQPVYNVFVLLKINIKGDGNIIRGYGDIPEYTHITTLPPGKTTVIIESSGHAMGGKFEIPEIYFTDVNEVNWTRNKFGKLTEDKNYETRFNRIGITPPYIDDEEKLEKQW